MPVPKRTHAYLKEIAAAVLKADPEKSHRSLSEDWGFERSYLHKLISGIAPAGSTVVARASLSISTSQARDLIERYLMDIGDQIDFERRRLRPNSLEPDGRYDVKVSVSWIPGQDERLPKLSKPLTPLPLLPLVEQGTSRFVDRRGCPRGAVFNAPSHLAPPISDLW